MPLPLIQPEWLTVNCKYVLLSHTYENNRQEGSKPAILFIGGNFYNIYKNFNRLKEKKIFGATKRYYI
jgi:hypothetical protein